MTLCLHQLSRLGQSVWIDYLSRDLLDSGALACTSENDAVIGVTSNPTIFEKALSRGASYDSRPSGGPIARITIARSSFGGDTV